MKNKQLVIGLLVGVVAVYAISSFIVTEKLDGLKIHLDEKISLQQEVVRELATKISGGGVNERVSSIILECPSDETLQHDRLLSSLDKGLSRAELQGLNILFKRCGAIPATKRAAMALLFEQEVKLFTELVNERALLGGVSANDFNVSKWNALVEREKEISALFFKLVDSQKQIISTLADGGNLQSVESFQIDATKIQTELSTITESAFEMRSVLIKS